MTASTEQERALANLRHLYKQMVNGAVKDSAQARRIAEMLLSPAIAKIEQAARRAPVVPPTVAQVEEAVGMGAKAWDCIAPQSIIDAVLALAAAPRPPEATVNESLTVEAAPVQLPEPDEYQYRTRPTWDEKHPWTEWAKCSKEAAADYERAPLVHEWAYEVRKLHTEHQVRQLLAAQEQSHGKQT